MFGKSTIACAAGVSLVICTVTTACTAAALPPSARILAAAQHAYGRVDFDRVGVLVETGSEDVSGLHGKWRHAEDTATGHMHESVDFGVYAEAEVLDGKDDWRQDHSGGVHALNSAFAKSHAVTQMWLARRGFLRPGADGANIEYLKAQQADGRSLETIRATPAGGQPVELWFDATTGLLERSIWEMPIYIETIRYQDYRRVSGSMVPFKTVETTDYSDSVDTVTVDKAEFVAKPADGEFAPLKTPNDSTVAGGVVTVPISYDGDVVIEAMLNGKGPFRFILDTGGHDILTPEAVKALGLTAVGAGQSGGAGAGTVSEQFARVATVQIGGVTLRDQAFFVDPLSYDTVEMGTKPPLAGIMGLELFERFAMELNYHAKTLTFRPIASAPPGHGTAVPISFTDDQPTYTAKIDGIAGANGLDTGNSGALVVQGIWAQNNGLRARMRQGLVTAGFGAGGMSQNWAVRADVEVAGVAFPHIVASYSEDKKGAFSSRIEAGNIGNRIYENFTLGFDYRRNIVWFDPQPGPFPAPRPYPRTGMSLFKKAPDAFTVAVVLPGGPAAEAGIAAGDEIVAVNGVAANTLSGWDMGRITRGQPGTKLKLDFTRAGTKQSAVVTLRELLP